jgi:hypothetical protein
VRTSLPTPARSKATIAEEPIAKFLIGNRTAS